MCRTRTKQNVKMLGVIAMIALMCYAIAQAADAPSTTDKVKADVVKAVDAAKKADVTQPCCMTAPNATPCKMMQGMHKCMLDCCQSCGQQMVQLKAAQDSLTAASEALDAGKSADAKIEVAKAQQLLTEVVATTQKMMDKMPVANLNCPMSGKPIDIMKTPQEQTRMQKDVKLGFGSAEDAKAWDRLEKTQKQEKAKKAIPDYVDPYMYM